MTSSKILSRPPGILFTEFQLEEMEKEQGQKFEMTLIQLTKIDAAIKDDAALVNAILKLIWNRLSSLRFESWCTNHLVII